MSRTSPPDTVRGLWPRWVVANSLAEGVGLTASLAMGAGAFAINDRIPLPAALGMALGVALTGAVVEGLAVGTAQWWAMRRALPSVGWLPWALATALGAFVAWALGMLPTTLISSVASAAPAGATAAGAAPVSGTSAEPALWLQLLLAALMGLVLGPILGIPQWRVLRRHIPRAGWWVAANATAWAAGMPVIFLATALIEPGWATVRIAVMVGLACCAAGAVVGFVEGAWLRWMLRSRPVPA